MKIYKEERDLNLTNKISFASQIILTDPFDVVEEVINSCNATTMIQQSLENKQMDLYYFRAILTTIGLNKNDDYFDIAETWAARKTPEDKQINYEHNERDIIGHMTGCYALNADLSTVLDDKLTVDELPNKYHLVTAGVLYKRWDDQKLQARMDTIINDIQKGDMFVSMECLFSDFDYILIDGNNGTSEIVSRGKETAFLTKYLRGFGGSGVYNSRRIGRVLKNIVFSGKGMVKRPANPESIILAEASETQIGDYNTMPENKVLEVAADTMNTRELKALEKQIAALNSALDAERQEKENEKAQAAKDAQAKVAKELEDLKSALANTQNEVKELNDKLAKADEAVVAANTEKDKFAAEAQAVKEELNKIAADNKVQKRIALLVDNGYEKDEAVELEKKFAKVDDDAFEAIAEMTKKDKKDKKDMKHDESCAKDKDQDNEANADPAVLQTLAAQAGLANVVKNVDPEGSLLEQFMKSTSREMKLCKKFHTEKE